MKTNILIILCFLFALHANTQNRTIFICETSEECQERVNDLLKDAKRSYTLKDSFPHGNYEFIMDYEETNPETNNPLKIRAIFKKRMIGANPDLEIKGKPQYSLTSVSGKFLDLVSIWTKYIDPNADIEALAQKDYAQQKDFSNPDGSSEKYNFRRSNNNKTTWIFERRAWSK